MPLGKIDPIRFSGLDRTQRWTIRENYRTGRRAGWKILEARTIARHLVRDYLQYNSTL